MKKEKVKVLRGNVLNKGPAIFIWKGRDKKTYENNLSDFVRSCKLMEIKKIRTQFGVAFLKSDLMNKHVRLIIDYCRINSIEELSMFKHNLRDMDDSEVRYIARLTPKK